jgi:chitodextrinase
MMKRVLKIICLVILVCVTFSTVYSAEDTFQINQVIISSDFQAPSVPANLTATAISSSQINLSWTASTDNVAVTGYQVFRDGLFIATSTLTSYSDVGLTPETTYTYTVTAFDYAQNISAESDASMATTLAVVVPPIASPGGGGSVNQTFLLLNLKVEPSLYSSLIRFDTNLYSQVTVFWGVTPDYEMGSIAGQSLTKNHSINIEGLTPATNYYFKIELTDQYERKLYLSNQTFVTKSLPDLIPPQNVTNLFAVGNDQVINLSWNNPKVDFSEVRIVRSDKFYPKDLFDGKIVYEGRAEKFVDTDVSYGKDYYYTLFVKDSFGNYSSGAVAKARLYKFGEKPVFGDFFGDVVELAQSLVHPVISALTLLDIDFFQNGKKLSLVSDNVHIQGDRELKISLDYDKMPEILKTIVITMRDPDDKTKTFSFLLRVNKDKTAYEATIAPLGRSGNFEFGIAIMDHKNQGLKKMAGIIVSFVPNLGSQTNVYWNVFFVWFKNNFATLIVSILLLIATYFGFRLVRVLKK